MVTVTPSPSPSDIREFTTPEPCASLRRLWRLTERLAGKATLPLAMQYIVEAGLELLPADHVSVRLLDRETEQLGSMARAGVGVGTAPIRFERGEGLLGWVVNTGRIVRLGDAPRDDRFRPRNLGFAVRSVLAVPIWSGGVVAGVLAASHAEAERFGRHDESTARLLAALAGPHVARQQHWRDPKGVTIEHTLASPLRLRLTAELLDVGEVGLSLEDAVVRSGRYQKDVEACLAPMVQMGMLEFDSRRYRLSTQLPGDALARIEAHVKKHADQIGRERHIRNHLLGGMIGVDAKMQVVFELVRQVARIDVAVLITGETGTGKELVARAIHDVSPRRDSFFGAVNCATLTESLFESQVFGHARGAFTGAVSDYTGLVERCHRGTLFLDEVGDLSLANQVKLLRLLQEGSFLRLGENEPRHSDFRLISATNRDLESMVAHGTFREDLYYRLAVFPIRLPSLRERKGDLKYLVDGILQMHAQRFRTGDQIPAIAPEALRQLEKYNWPGNVRELENVMVRALVMAGGGPIGTQHLPEVELLSDTPPDSSRPPVDSHLPFVPITLEEAQRIHIEAMLRKMEGNIKATAMALGISRTTLYKKIRDYGIDAPV
ncbi:MAG: sigma 54-interacting transcriptional regulator [Myxococcota bacterium]